PVSLLVKLDRLAPGLDEALQQVEDLVLANLLVAARPRHVDVLLFDRRVNHADRCRGDFGLCQHGVFQRPGQLLPDHWWSPFLFYEHIWRLDSARPQGTKGARAT